MARQSAPPREHSGRIGLRSALWLPIFDDLADPAVAEGILTASGFAEVSLTDVHELVYYGRDSATAYDFVLGLRDTKDLLANLDAAMAGRALQRLRATLAAHDTGSGVFFDSRAWIIAARRH